MNAGDVMDLGTALTIVHAMARSLFKDHGEFCEPARNPSDAENALNTVEDFIVNQCGEEESDE